MPDGERTPKRADEEAQRFMAEASSLLSSSLRYHETLASVARLAVPRLGDWCAVDVIDEDGSLKRLAVEHEDPKKLELAHVLQERYPPDPDEPGGVLQVVRSGQPEFYPEITNDMFVAAAHNDEHLRLMREIGFTSVIIVPLVARGRTLGVIILVTAESGRRYGEADLELAEELARRAALAVDNARLYEEAQKEISEREKVQQELRSSRNQLEIILQGVGDGITAQDPNGRLIYANEAAARILGYPSVQALLEASPRERMERFELVTDESGQPFPPSKLPGRRALRGEEGAEAVVCFREVSTGEERWSVVKATPVFDEQGEVRFAVNIFRDITERKKAEETRARLAAIVESSDDVIIGKTLDGIITNWNLGAQRLYGYSSEEVVGKPINILVPPDRPNEIPRIMEKLRRGEAINHYETVRITKDRRLLDVSLTISPIKDSSGNIVGASTIARDITERKRTEEALREVREAERSRIARELHDGALQDLTYALAEAQLIRTLSEDQQLNARLDQEIAALKRAAQELRSAVYDLRLEESVQRSVVSTVEDLVDLNRRMGQGTYEVELVVEEGFPRTLSGRAGTELARILREALNNARRHSQAKNVRVVLGVEGNDCWAQVADDGQGFEPRFSRRGVGMSSMQERAEALGGEVEVESEPGKGTRALVRFPCQHDQEE